MISIFPSCSLAIGSRTSETNSLMPEFPPSFPPMTDLVLGMMSQVLWSFTRRVIGQVPSPWFSKLLRHLLSWPQLLPRSQMTLHHRMLPFNALCTSSCSFWSIFLSFTTWTCPASRYWSLVSTQKRPDLSVWQTIISPPITLFFRLFNPLLSPGVRLSWPLSHPSPSFLTHMS